MNQARTLAILGLALPLAACVDDPAVIDQDSADIVNGDPIPETQLPFVGMLVDFNTSSLCSGTLLSERVVLTAAHCVPDDGNLSGLAFTTAAQFSTSAKFIQVVDARVQFKWPRGDIQQLTRGDLALLQLGEPVVLASYPALLSNPLQLVPAVSSASFSTLTIVGYGLNTNDGGAGIKRAGIVGFVGWTDVDGSPTATPKDFQAYGALVGREELACPGDSGGPALLGNVIAGVTHAGTVGFGPCDPNNASFYTSIAPYHSWIVAKAAELSGLYGDLDRNGKLELADLDAFGVGLRKGTFDPVFDIDNDGDVDMTDGDLMVLERVGIVYGDINGDGFDDGSDFLFWQRNLGKTTGKWIDGDMTFDGKTDGNDLEVWKRNYGTQAPTQR